MSAVLLVVLVLRACDFAIRRFGVGFGFGRDSNAVQDNFVRHDAVCDHYHNKRSQIEFEVEVKVVVYHIDNRFLANSERLFILAAHKDLFDMNAGLLPRGCVEDTAGGKLTMPREPTKLTR